jgi:hypothetical protein
MRRTRRARLRLNVLALAVRNTCAAIARRCDGIAVRARATSGYDANSTARWSRSLRVRPLEITLDRCVDPLVREASRAAALGLAPRCDVLISVYVTTITAFRCAVLLERSRLQLAHVVNAAQLTKACIAPARASHARSTCSKCADQRRTAERCVCVRRRALRRAMDGRCGAPRGGLHKYAM